MVWKSWRSWACKPIPYSHLQHLNNDFASNSTEISQITPVTALYYSFHTTSTTPTSQPVGLLGPTAALEQLLAKGCMLVTKPWVDNHWAMVLWKLAGMVCLDPERESDGRSKRWCWSEVMRQLLYRYFFVILMPVYLTNNR